MIKKIIVIAILSLVLFQSSAFAFDTDGEVVFTDTFYGAAIGGLLGSAMYVADQNDFGAKISTGVIIGTLAGLAYGLNETSTFVELKDNKIKMAIPTPVIVPIEGGVQYTASLFKTRF
ncbi:hypothetical protein BMS3Abin09_00345 [bacterium BMS3Abin09]|nr:hypothetical protein BMS3Abin09_00345 [bacterium BMS3Abin09]GBE41041.1 hypothetical protein BMS3Bbin09_00930 [bacterium BMS3Bbin09]HDH34702.1 glycine zipper family protein [Nitrospirota bacterium]HDN95262.1 glycine zipper family protein [Nitrospirota bacterium]HDO67570.1 glycine zipper family protein [Nitrospirota bacterium]